MPFGDRSLSGRGATSASCFVSLHLWSSLSQGEGGPYPAFLGTLAGIQGPGRMQRGFADSEMLLLR